MQAFRVFAGAALLSAFPLWSAGADAGGALRAVWKEQRLEFVYVGRTSRYSCEGLRDKMRSLLLGLGARRDLKIAATGCDDSVGRLAWGGLGPNLSIDFSSPALPNASSKPLNPGDLAPVLARYEAFILTTDPFRNLSIGDCELIEEFARQILPKLAARDVKQDITCVPYQFSGSRFLVRGEVLKVTASP